MGERQYHRHEERGRLDSIYVMQQQSLFFFFTGCSMSFSSYFFWFCLILALGYKLSNVNATREGLAEENGGNESIDQNASRKIGVSSYDLNTHLQARNIAEGARPMLLVITFLAYRRDHVIYVEMKNLVVDIYRLTNVRAAGRFN